MSVIAVLGTLDTKGHEHAFVAAAIRARGHSVLLIDVGTGGPPQVVPDIARETVARHAGVDLEALSARGDRGEAVSAMADAATRLVTQLAHERRIDGIISLGGGGGTAIATAAMRGLPIGFPKLMVSTLAGGNTAHYVGTKDIVMMPAVLDVAGLNRISRTIYAQAAGAICGMVEATHVVLTDRQRAAPKSPADAPDRPIVVASMFGNTTAAVEQAKEVLERAGYEVLVFHATGTGGRAMEALIESGMVAGVLDITTTEWADELVGGVLSAGPDRLDAAAHAGVPAIVVPGCLDMVNFGEPASVPSQFDGRNFYQHNPQVTLMRTTPEECRELGRILALKLNAYTAPVTVLVPLRGISAISKPGGPFCDPAADEALFDSLASCLRPEIELRRLDYAINDRPFAEACATALLANIVKRNPAKAKR